MGPDVNSRALIDEAMKKSGLIWLQVQPMWGEPISRAAWHAWVDGHDYVLTGPGEQPDLGFAGGETTSVVVRSKDNTARLVVFTALVTLLSPDDDDWQPATEALAKGRLNLSDAEHAPDRWRAGDVTIWRLTPTGDVLEEPGSYGDESHRLSPIESPATTRSKLPRVFHRRGHSGRRLS